MSLAGGFPLVLTSPEMRGPLVKQAQRAMAHNEFGTFYDGALDGIYGELTSQGAHRTKFWIGYDEDNLNGVYGAAVHAFLTGAAELSPQQLKRRKERQAEAIRTPLRSKALGKMKEWIGTIEEPAGSNNIFVSRWYMNMPGGWRRDGPAYCAMTVTKAYVDVGAKHFGKIDQGNHWAYVPTILGDARAGRYELAITRKPRPGDLVLFDWGDDGNPDHIGLFDMWIIEGKKLITVEGNTQDGIWRRDDGKFPSRSMADVAAFVHVGK